MINLQLARNWPARYQFKLIYDPWKIAVSICLQSGSAWCWVTSDRLCRRHFCQPLKTATAIRKRIGMARPRPQGCYPSNKKSFFLCITDVARLHLAPTATSSPSACWRRRGGQVHCSCCQGMKLNRWEFRVPAQR